VISKIGGVLCVLNSKAWRIIKFGKSLPSFLSLEEEKSLVHDGARKDDGRYRAHCVARGFSQIPGKYLQENHAPVIADTTLHLLKIIKTLFKLEAGQFDIETAFLYGKLEEDLWRDIPDGYPKFCQEKYGKQLNNKTHCLKLTKAIYALVQAARQWWKKFKEELKILGHWPSRADPCIFIRKEGKGNRSCLIIYVDDGGIFARPAEVKRILTE
jgi:hypothetical protein